MILHFGVSTSFQEKYMWTANVMLKLFKLSLYNTENYKLKKGHSRSQLLSLALRVPRSSPYTCRKRSLEDGLGFAYARSNE